MRASWEYTNLYIWNYEHNRALKYEDSWTAHLQTLHEYLLLRNMQKRRSNCKNFFETWNHAVFYEEERVIGKDGHVCERVTTYVARESMNTHLKWWSLYKWVTHNSNVFCEEHKLWGLQVRRFVYKFLKSIVFCLFTKQFPKDCSYPNIRIYAD